MLKAQQEKQRVYVELLTKKAKEEALSRLHTPDANKPLLFDPQGRVLINVTLSEDEKGQFDNLGHKPTEVTTVSLDVFDDPELKQAYSDQYGFNAQQSQTIEAIRGSVIPLQQEYHFHLALAARSYVTAKRFTEAQMEQAHAQTMIKVQDLIVKATQEALAKATDKKTGAIDDVKFVQAQDKARKNIAQEAHRMLAEEIVRATGEILTKKEVKALDLKHSAEVTTATPNDVVHVDLDMGQTTLIAGSRVTAHDRGIGKEHLADRRIITLAHDAANQCPPRIQVRVPSLDVKEDVTPEEAIADVQDKLNYLNNKYEVEASVDEGVGKIKAFTYNLHTALNDRFEGGKNKQSQGARYILLGAHNYNQAQFKAAELDKEKIPVFCLVQNISVNGFGDSLGYGRNALRNEATLMTEMSMIYNLVDQNDPQREHVEAAFSAYKDYLNSNAPLELLFSESPHAEKAKAAIQEVKKGWANKSERAVEVDEGLNTAAQTVKSAKIALKVMMANNLHQSHDYAKLFQSMSVFVEQASFSGCKSGNERAQAINGRINVLDSVASQVAAPTVMAIKDLPQAVSSKEVATKAADLKQAFDAQYDLRLHSGPSILSAVDQGAAAKVNAKRGFAGLFNRNYAEESTLEHLQQGNAGKMQAHKGLTNEAARAWDGPQPKGYFAFMREKWGVGIIGAMALSVVGLFQYNGYRKDVSLQKEEFMNNLKQAQGDYQCESAKAVEPVEVKVDELLQEAQDHVLATMPEVNEVAPEPKPTPEVVGQWRNTRPASIAEGNTDPSMIKANASEFKSVLEQIKNIGTRHAQDEENKVEPTPGMSH